MAFLLAGAAAHPDLWRLAVPDGAGRAVALHGLQVVGAEAGPWPVPVPGKGTVEALALTPPPDQAAGLTHLLIAFGFYPEARPEGQLWFGRGSGTAPVLAPEVLAVLVAAGAEILRWRGQVAAEDLARRLTPILVRAASRLRAEATPRLARLRHATAAADLAPAGQRLPYAHFFALEEHDLAWRRFDGSLSPVATRAAFISGDAVTVLPYDPRRDRVLVVEQFRAGPLARGDRELWQIEAIAGRIDPFETPETAARREAVEEAGLTLADLQFVARYYPSPGAVSEYIYSYVALTDLPDGAAGVFGLAEEAEDIRGHLLDFAAFMDLVASGEIDNAPLTLTALWLQRERGRLRGS